MKKNRGTRTWWASFHVLCNCTWNHPFFFQTYQQTFNLLLFSQSLPLCFAHCLALFISLCTWRGQACLVWGLWIFKLCCSTLVYAEPFEGTSTGSILLWHLDQSSNSHFFPPFRPSRPTSGSTCDLVRWKSPLFTTQGHRCLYVCLCDNVHVSERRLGMPAGQRASVMSARQRRPQVLGRYWKRILLSQVKLGTA